jgi:triacylglycerol lipase
MSELEFFDSSALLSPPVKRAAYSDRTAWLMAEMSRLAYEKFEGNNSLKEISAKLANVSDTREIEKIMAVFLAKLKEAGETGEEHLADELKRAQFTLIRTYDAHGTQAFLASLNTERNKREGMLVLAFRGTETVYEDIRSDLTANLITDGSGHRVHKGFYDALFAVGNDIKADLVRYPDLPIYITGHSLGGALAVLATKYLASDSVGACYTFGSPRVGDRNLGQGIKTPIYRVVNSADGVPRVPPSWFVDILIFLVDLIPFRGLGFVSGFLHKLQGYVHFGDMRYLTHVVAGADDRFKGLQLISNPSLVARATKLFGRITTGGFKVMGQDHSIALYSKKLRYHALNQNVSVLVNAPDAKASEASPETAESTEPVDQ